MIPFRGLQIASNPHRPILWVGSETSPSLTFMGDLDTGLYRVSADILGITRNGTKAAEFGSTFLSVNPVRANGAAQIGGAALSIYQVDRSQVILSRDNTSAALSLLALSASNNAYIASNGYWDSAAWNRGGTGAPVWSIQMLTTAFILAYKAAGSGTFTSWDSTPLEITTGGLVKLATAATIGGTTQRNAVPLTLSRTDNAHIALMRGTADGGTIMAFGVGGRVHLNSNSEYNGGWVSINTAQPSWLLGVGADSFDILRAPATAGVPAFANFFSINSAGETTLPAATKLWMGVHFQTGYRESALANNSYIDLGNFRGMVIVSNATDNGSQVCLVQASSNTIASISSVGLSMNLNSDAGSTLSFYWTGTAFIVRNRYGSTKDIRVHVLAN